MKKLLLMTFIFTISSYVLSADKRVYSEKDFNEKLEKELDRKISLIKKKSITQLTKELLDKEAKLNEREKELAMREEQIGHSEKSLLKEIDRFEGDKKKIIGCLDKNKESETLRIKQLVSVISNMRPQKAAEVLSVQESRISVKLIEKIDPAKASKIFNLMDKEVSARLQKQYLNMQQ